MFDLEKSQERAERRFSQLARRDTTSRPRRPRSDRGRLRISPSAQRWLEELLGGYEKPATRHMIDELERRCAEAGLRAPSRATVYKLIDVAAGPTYSMEELPPAVQQALYNLDSNALVPGRQVAFYCFNYGDLGALCYAAGMPWLALRQAGRVRGWRDKSRGLWEAVCRARRI